MKNHDERLQKFVACVREMGYSIEDGPEMYSGFMVNHLGTLTGDDGRAATYSIGLHTAIIDNSEAGLVTLVTAIPSFLRPEDQDVDDELVLMESTNTSNQILAGVNACFIDDVVVMESYLPIAACVSNDAIRTIVEMHIGGVSANLEILMNTFCEPPPCPHCEGGSHTPQRRHHTATRRRRRTRKGSVL